MNVSQKTQTSALYFGVPNTSEEISEDTIVTAVERTKKIYKCTFCGKTHKSNSSSWQHVRRVHHHRPLSPREKRTYRKVIQKPSKRVTSRKKTSILTIRQKTLQPSRKELLVNNINRFIFAVETFSPENLEAAEEARKLLSKLTKSEMSVDKFLND